MNKSQGKSSFWGVGNGEKKLFRLRRKINRLYFEEGVTKNKLSKRYRLSKKFVIRWTRDREQNFSEDMRGWKKGRGRKWSEEDRDRIREIHQSLISDPHQFYWGATAIEQEWRKRFPSLAVPPLRTIGEILSDSGLSGSRRGKKNKGAARYLCYPEHTIYEFLGYRVLEADFVGCKFFSGSNKPLNFIGFGFKKAPRLRYFKRIPSETSSSFASACEYFFENFEIPDAIKVDNCAATIGGNVSRRTLSRTIEFLLKNRVVPIFSVPRKPFSQASIEGNNSVFSKKFWNPTYFESLQEVDTKLQWFNDASEKYTGYQRPTAANEKKEFLPKVFFIRQVKEGNSSNGTVHVLNEKIDVPDDYINYFVLAEWNLGTEQLMIYFEKDQHPELIQQIHFPVLYNANKRRSTQRFKTIKQLCEKSN